VVTKTEAGSNEQGRRRAPWPTWILRYRRPLFALLTVITLAAVPLAVQIRFDFNFQEYFPESDPVRNDYRRLVAEFPAEESEFIVLIEDDEIFSAAGIDALVALTADLESAEWFAEVTGPANLPASVFGTFRDTYTRMLAGEPTPAAEYADLRRRVVEHPLLRKNLVDDTGNVVVIRAAMRPEQVTDRGREAVRRYLVDLLPGYEQTFDAVVYTGFSGVRADFAQVMKREQQVLFPVVLIALVAVLLFFLGRSWLVAFPLLVSSAALTWTLAIMVLRDAPFTILSTGTPVLLLILGISDSLHLFYRYRAARCDGMGQDEAVVVTFGELGRACFFTSLTTAVGFIALTATNLPVLADFGFYTGLGIALNFVAMMLALPILLASRPARDAALAPCDAALAFERRCPAGLIALSRQPRAWIPVFALAVILPAIGIVNLTEDTRVHQGLAQRNWLDQKIRRAEAMVNGLLPFGVVLHMNSEADLTSRDTLRRVDALQRYLERNADVVGSAHSVVDLARFVRYVDDEKLRASPFFVDLGDLDEDPAEWEIDDFDVVGQRLNARLRDLREENALLVDGVVSFAANDLLVRARLYDVSSDRLRSFFGELDTFLKQQQTDGTSFTWTVAGLPNLSLNLAERVISYMVGTFVLSLLVILAGFAYAFRCPRMASISLVPNLIPLVIILGALGWLDIPLQPSIIIIFSIVYGIAVNDTIHFIARFALERHENTTTAATEAALEATVAPMVASSAVLIVGFAVLTYSEFLGLAYLGLLLGLGILAALVADLLLLPLALKRWVPASVEILADTAAEDPTPPAIA
jgi:predicted RND superfamily exporter protein